MVWFLLVTGILLIFFNIKAVKKDEASFGKVFRNTEADMTEVDVRIGELRREFSETILELQKEIQKLQKNEVNSSIDEKEIIEEEIEEKKIEQESNLNEDLNISLKEDTINKTEDIKIKSNSIKIEEINSMLSMGYSVEDISTKLGIGKGEVLLIKELYLK